MSFTHSDQPTFALVDCNNFYVSCERLFNPKLNNVPVIILSSNDGCVIARSNEAKALGIQMSQPYFQISSLCEKNRVHVLSSNFALYGDLSKRVMNILATLCRDIEIYSIDEAFLRLDTVSDSEVVFYADYIRCILLKYVGIPVSVGIAHTKTLAKAAAYFAKKNDFFSKNNVCDLRNNKTKNQALQNLSVGDIWGIGKKTATQLQYMKINTAIDLCQTNFEFLKKRFSIAIKKTAMELKGTVCLTREDMHQKKSITYSRSFSEAITNKGILLQIISRFVASACEKAREEKLKSSMIVVYIRTSVFDDAYHSRSELMQLLHPSNDTIYITRIAQALLKKIYRPHFKYKKAGITLCELVPEQYEQSDLFCDPLNDNCTVMNIMDRINKKFGKHQIYLAAEGTKPNWMSKTTLKTPSYTTKWNELKRVQADGCGYVCSSSVL